MAIAERDAAAAARASEIAEWARAVAERDGMIAERDALLGERDGALLAASERISQLDRVGAHLSRLVVRRERELDELREQIDEVCAQARGYATRVRMQALRQAASIAAPNGNGASANGKHGGESGVGELAEEDAPAAEAEGEHEAAAEITATAPQSGFGLRPATSPDLFEGIVQLEIGPLADFSQLVGFEDAAGTIGAASEISVTRFSRGRASLDVRLTEPVDLLRELGRRSPFEFRVRSVRDGRLILDLDDEAEAA